MKRRLNEIYVKHTGQSYEKIERTLDRDHFMTAEEAREFGLIDKVISTRDASDGAGEEGLSRKIPGRAGARCAGPLSFGRRRPYLGLSGRRLWRPGSASDGHGAPLSIS